MSTTKTDDQFTWLRNLGYTGSMDDMLYAYLKGAHAKSFLGTAVTIQDLKFATGWPKEAPVADPATRTPTSLGPPNSRAAAASLSGWAAQGSGVSIAASTDAQFILPANSTGTAIDITNANAGVTAILRANASSNWVPAVQGKFYTLSAYVKWITGTLKQARLDVRFLDALGNQLALQVGTLNTISAAAVTRIVNNDNLAPFGTAFVEARAVVPSCAVADVFRVSNFFLEVGNWATAPPYNGT